MVVLLIAAFRLGPRSLRRLGGLVPPGDIGGAAAANVGRARTGSALNTVPKHVNNRFTVHK